MAAKKNNVGKIDVGRITSAAMAARENQYLQRLIEDRELRETLRGAYSSARGAYGRMNNGKAPAKALFDDRRAAARNRGCGSCASGGLERVARRSLTQAREAAQARNAPHRGRPASSASRSRSS